MGSAGGEAACEYLSHVECAAALDAMGWIVVMLAVVTLVWIVKGDNR